MNYFFWKGVAFCSSNWLYIYYGTPHHQKELIDVITHPRCVACPHVGCAALEEGNKYLLVQGWSTPTAVQFCLYVFTKKCLSNRPFFSFSLSHFISTILNLSLFPLSFHISFSFSNCTHYTQTFSFSFSFSLSLSLSLLHYFPQFLQHCIGHLRQHSQRPNRQQSHQKQQTFFLNQKNMMHSISAVKNIAIQ